MSRHEQLRRIAYESAYMVQPSDFFKYWEAHRELLIGCRMVFSDPRSNKSPLPGELSARTFGDDPNVYLNSFYDAPGHFCFTNKIVTNFRNGKNMEIKRDWTVSLDSNFVGDIHKFMTRKSLEQRTPAFLEAATYLRQNRINMDATPYLFENFKKAKTSPKHLDFVVNGFAMFYQFTTGVPLIATPTGLSDFEFSISEAQAKQLAETRVHEMLNDPAMIKDEVRCQFHRQDSHLALLLTAIEYYGKRYSSIKDKLYWVMGELESNVGRIPERELMFALRAFNNPNDYPFFSHQWPKPYNRKQNIVELVRNMAWDVSFFRMMQIWATKKDGGLFAFPYFLTFDWKLAGMNDIYTCRILLIDDFDNQVYSLAPASLQQEFEALDWWDDLKQFFSIDRIENRRRSIASYDELTKKCHDAEEELHKIVYGVPLTEPDE